VTGWDALVSTALLGTERRPPQPPDGDGVLGAIDWSDPEGALLAAAAVVATARAAGAAPAAVPPPEPAPPDGAPPCSREADAVLARVLAEQPDLLGEWLERAASAGLAAWPRRLPELLTAGTYDRELRGPVLRAGGRRVGWLAGQLRDWSWATSDPADAEAWETGARQERLAMLSALRAEDPAAARALVESTWDADSAEDRRAFLTAMQEGLSHDDEPLLERALDDRRKDVRLSAARLLGRLPESALAGRMADRLAPLIEVTGTVRKRIEVETPEAVDAAMTRDGIEEKGAPRGSGPRGYWLRQIVWAAPLRVWTERTQMAPQRIIELLRGEEALVQAIAQAAHLQRDAEWAAAFARHSGSPSFLASAPSEAVAPVVRELVDAARRLDEVFELAAAAEGSWDRETSLAILDAVERAELPQQRHWLRRTEVVPLAFKLDPALLDRATEVLAKHDGTGIAPDAVGEALAVLDLRHAIHREIP
jgi:hypothetical protein